MRRTLAVILASLALPAAAAEGVELAMSARDMAAVGALPAGRFKAPFRSRDPMPELLLREELASRGPRGSCETATTDLCYDLRDGRIVYRRARAYMPRIEGLTAESISLRRDRIIFKYSF
jgi:hypothetical protein